MDMGSRKISDVWMDFIIYIVSCAMTVSMFTSLMDWSGVRTV